MVRTPPLSCAHCLHWCLFTDKWGLRMTGVIQCSEKDEFAYQEMIAHLPLCGLAVRAGFQRCLLHICHFCRGGYQQAFKHAGSTKEGVGGWRR